MSTQILFRPKALSIKKEVRPSVVARHASKKIEAEKDLSKTYNEFKQFEGAQYTGMKGWPES